MRILAPLRPDDLVNSYSAAPLAVLEEITALDRLPLSAITPHDSGTFTFRLNNSDRFKKWWFNQTDVRHLFQLDVLEYDRFGSHLLLVNSQVNRILPAMYGAVCPWTAIPQAAQLLRALHIGPAFWDAYSQQDNFLGKYLADVVQGLGLVEQPLNGRDLPAISRLKWGLLLRLGPADVERTLHYLALEKPHSVAPVRADLGAHCSAFAAWSSSKKEPLRICVSSPWNEDLALKDVSRWLRGFEAHSSTAHLIP
jgi:hypothetical protein